jgi:hypothetical protein
VAVIERETQQRLFAEERARDWLPFLSSVAVLVVASAMTAQTIGDWSFFRAAASTLASSRWRFVYVDNPGALTGPITIGLAWLLPSQLVRLGVLATGIATMALLTRSSQGLDAVRWRLLIGGAIVMCRWPLFAYMGHLDDALVLALATGAIVATMAGRDTLAAVLAGLAIGVKPTAVFLVALPLTAYRDRVRLTAIAGVVASAAWLPFIVGAPGTLGAMRPRRPIMPDSVVGLVLEPITEPPTALRVVQLVAMVGLTWWAASRRGPAAVLLVGVVVRVLLDHAAWLYLTPGLLLGALVWDLHSSSRPIPWTTVAVGALIAMPEWLIDDPTSRAWLRLSACVVVLALVAGRHATSTTVTRSLSRAAT